MPAFLIRAAPAPALLAAVPPALAPAPALLAHAAQQQAPYQLLAHALGHDPLTGRPAPAAPRALARALVGLLPDGPARFQQLQAAGPALAHLPAWLHHQLAGPRLAHLLAQTAAQLPALGWRDLLAPLATFERLAQPWLALGQDVARFVVRTEAALLRWLLAAVLGPDQAAPVLRALDQGGDLLLRILRHPLPFLTNLVTAGQRGFAAFLANGPRHLRAAVQDWLLGGLANAGLHLPAKLDLAGLLDLLLQVFDLTKAAVLHRLRLPTLPTERLQQVLTQVGGVALALWQHGPQAAWQAISAHAQGLHAQALDFVQQQVLGVAAKAVPLFLASLAVPGGAFLQLARGLYNGVMLFVAKGKQLAQVGQALFASASAIAAGQLTPAAQAVENTLVKLLPVALNFLGRLLRLDAIPHAIQTGLQKVRVPVEKAVNKVLDTVADKAKAIWGAVKTGAGQALNKGKARAASVGTTVKGWLGIEQKFVAHHEPHTLFFDQSGQLMLASDAAPYQRFLNAFAAQQTPGTAPTLRLARTQVSEVRRLSRARQDLETKQSANQTSRPPRPDAALTLALNENEHALNLALQVLAAQTATLMQSVTLPGGGGVLANSPVLFAGTSAGGFGRGALVEYLTQMGNKGGSPTAGIPAGAGAQTHTTLAKRLTAGNIAYYRMGHLLNADLGGPGNDWRNLTPLSPRDNSLHYSRFESEVQKIRKAFHPAAPTQAFFYSVVPQYAHPLRQDVLAAAQHEAGQAARQLAGLPGGDPAIPALELARQHYETVADILRAEQYVPRSLTCRVQELDPDSRAPLPGGLDLNLTIENPLDQSGLQAYATGIRLPGQPNVVIKNPRREIFINQNIPIQELQNPLVLGLSQRTAQLLIDALAGGANQAPLRISRYAQLEDFIRKNSEPVDMAQNIKAAEAARDAKRIKYSL